MKKSYKIEVECANCAQMMEDATKKIEGVKDATVNFMALKMKVEFADGSEPAEVMPRVLEACRSNANTSQERELQAKRDWLTLTAQSRIQHHVARKQVFS